MEDSLKSLSSAEHLLNTCRVLNGPCAWTQRCGSLHALHTFNRDWHPETPVSATVLIMHVMQERRRAQATNAGRHDDRRQCRGRATAWREATFLPGQLLVAGRIGITVCSRSELLLKHAAGLPLTAQSLLAARRVRAAAGAAAPSVTAWRRRSHAGRQEE